MNRRLLIITAPALALALFACGSGDNGGNQAAGAQPFKSRLNAFDAGGLQQDMQLPDLTQYWTGAEARNGNQYPISAKLEDSVVMGVRLNSEGKYARAVKGEWRPESLISVSAEMQHLAQRHWIEERQTSSAAMILFADLRAPFDELLRLCKGLAESQLRNLWLVTHDGRDDALRLLPIFVDTAQVFSDWYTLPDDELVRTARFRLSRSQSTEKKNTRSLSHLGRELTAVGSGADWAGEILPAFKDARVERVQFRLPADAPMLDFARAVEALSPLGFIHVEPLWAALDWQEETAVVEKRRDLDIYEDAMGAAEGIKLPTMSEYWRASESENGLSPAAGVDDALPQLGIRVNANGDHLTHGVSGNWESHSGDVGVLEAMQRSAGEIDFDTGLSDLQILLAMDREASWESFLGILEMMVSVRCYRLLVIVWDALGPTLRLVDLSLPLSDVPSNANVARVKLERKGIVADGNYKVDALIDGVELQTSGSTYNSTLAKWAESRREPPAILTVGLPRDEPFGTLFSLVNSLAWLGMGGIRIGE